MSMPLFGMEDSGRPFRLQGSGEHHDIEALMPEARDNCAQQCGKAAMIVAGVLSVGGVIFSVRHYDVLGPLLIDAAIILFACGDYWRQRRHH